jgi:hypothetical protein
MAISPPQRPSAAGQRATELVRALVQPLPFVTERESHGEAAWFINEKKNFAAMRDHHHDERVAVVLAAGAGVQAALTANDPKHFFIPPYVGSRGWIGIYLDVQVSDQITERVMAELIADAWLVVAPVKLHHELRGS